MTENQVFQNILINDLDQSYQAFFDPKRPDSKRPKIKQKIKFGFFNNFL